MVKIHLSQERFYPGDDLGVVLVANPNESIQLMSIRCLGYIRLPSNVVRDMPDRDKYTFKDKPIGPDLPADSFLLWYTSNYPVHIDETGSGSGLVKLFLPFFLPPSIKGGLFEISHFVEVAILKKGDMDLRLKRIPLHVSSLISEMPKRFAPTVGDGYDQFDFSVRPTFQSTPHGLEASNWESEYTIARSRKPVSSSVIYRSRRTFKISFNGKHATEVAVFGEWSDKDFLIAEAGTVCPISFRFDQPDVLVKRIKTTLFRTESLTNRTEVFESSVWSSPSSLSITQHVVETSIDVPLNRGLCPSFSSDLVGIAYRIEFELRAMDAQLTVLEPVTWSLPVEVRAPSRDEMSPGVIPTPALPLGAVPSLTETFKCSVVCPVQTQQECETEQVVANSTVFHPGSMRFTVHS